ncbi:hypothetical protein C3L33_00866, partial [Rhododendron williamsianum]
MMITEASSSCSTLQGLDDVEEFVGGNEGDSASMMSVERLFHVSDLMQMGNQAFRDNRFEEAINYYSRANTIKPGNSVILSNRCGAYLRPPSASEHKPLSGLDPTTHAELALKDAEKVVSIRTDSVKSYILKANALILILGPAPTIGVLFEFAGVVPNCVYLQPQCRKGAILCVDMFSPIDVHGSDGLERYELAREVILLGLQIDPMSYPLSVLERTIASTIGRRSQPERTDDFDCTLCLKLLYEPITTPCGHSFCRSCLFQSMDRGDALVVTDVHFAEQFCLSVPEHVQLGELLGLMLDRVLASAIVTLNNIIQKNFPEEYAERKLEHDSLTNYGADLLPLFVMDVILPCQKFHLNIFEPRYRLMVRRIMEGNRRMGMVITDSATGSIADVACEVEITECEPLPDGRFFLELAERMWYRKIVSFQVPFGMLLVLFVSQGYTVTQLESRRRFRIIRNWDQDGYRVAEVEWQQDTYPSEGTRDRSDASLQELTNNAAVFALEWMRRAREAAQQRRDRFKSLELDKAESMMPTTRDPERYTCYSNKSEATGKIATPSHERYKREDGKGTDLYAIRRTRL